MRSPLTTMIEQLGGVSPDPGVDEAAARVVLRAVDRGVLDGEGAREVLEMLGLAPPPANATPAPHSPLHLPLT